MRSQGLRFYVDENVVPDVAKILSGVYRRHRFSTPYQESLTGVQDVDLFADLERRGYHAIVTMDRRQLDVPEEREALDRHGLHWIGFPVPRLARGTDVIATQSATILAGMPHVLANWAGAPSAYHLPELPGTAPRVERLRR